MLQLLMILLGLNFNHTNTTTHSGKVTQNHPVTQNQPSNADGDTGGETWPLPPKK